MKTKEGTDIIPKKLLVMRTTTPYDFSSAILEKELGKKPGPRPFQSNQEKMNYAKAAILVRPGYEPALGHTYLQNENYISDDELSKFYIGGRIEINSQKRLKLW